MTMRVLSHAGLQHVSPLEEFPLAKWDFLVQVMLVGVARLTRAVLPGMRERGFGRIVNIGSIHALVATEPTLTRIRRGMELVRFRIVDDSGSADVTYFNQSYLRNSIKRGGSYIFFGKVTFDGAHRAMTNPVFEREDGPHAEKQGALGRPIA